MGTTFTNMHFILPKSIVSLTSALIINCHFEILVQEMTEVLCAGNFSSLLSLNIGTSWFLFFLIIFSCLPVLWYCLDILDVRLIQGDRVNLIGTAGVRLSSVAVSRKCCFPRWVVSQICWSRTVLIELNTEQQGWD